MFKKTVKCNAQNQITIIQHNSMIDVTIAGKVFIKNLITIGAIK
jgi:hypothetical protein